MPRDETSTCVGKEAFADRTLAAKGARRRRRDGKGGHEYKCPYCRQWHIGRRSPA